MKGDISADFHVPAKRFSGVRAQAGRVLTDADFNAAFDVLDSTMETLVRTLLCAAGSPDQGFRIQLATPVALALPGGGVRNTYRVEVAPGTFVLGGRATLLSSVTGSLAQSDWLSLLLTPNELPPAPAPGRTDLVWLEQVERPVRSVEDRELQERALGSADTTTRLRPQLRLRVLADVPADCSVAATTLRETLRLGGHALSADGTELLSGARLGLAFVEDGPGLDPCAPAGAAGYLGAENQTLKVMLTAPGRFVWAWDHGEPLYRVQVDAVTGEVVFLTEPRDPVLYPIPGQGIEILPWDVLLPNAEKAAAPLGHLARLTGHYDPQTRRIAYDGSLPATWQAWLNALPAAMLGRDDTPPRFFYARIWQAPTVGAGPDQPTGAGLVLSETGIALHFAGQGVPGDYWTASLRPDAPEVVQPWNLMIDPAAGEVPVAPPIGPRRFHAPLGLVTWPAAGGPAVIADCRNRFRSLCRIKGCCTYQVGDGHRSFGDFNSIQEAVEALPVEGGEICLLPGTHRGRVDLTGRRDITIHGCGYRSMIEIAADPNRPFRPGILLDRASGIRFADFAISGAGGPVFGAAERCEAITLERLRILARQTAAVALARVETLRIEDCEIEAEELPRALEAADIAGLLPLIFAAGHEIEIVANRIAVRGRDLNRNRIALGGIQIGGRSEGIRIEDNRIEGGNGNGITLGSLLPPRGAQGQDLVIYFPPWITIDEDGCVKVTPGGTVTIPGQDTREPPRSAGPLRDLRIRDNRILNHGGSGITVAHWFIPDAKNDIGTLDDIEIDEVEIDDNLILGCMQVGLGAALPIEAAFNSGYGGIALSSATDIRIHNNQIRDCGGSGRSPICGIYIRFAERLQIRENRISDNGRPASLTDPLLVGNIGGIVLSHVDGVEPDLGRAVREVPAAMIAGNTVVAPEGRALEMFGTGQMLVQGNALTSHGNNIGGVILMLLFSLLNRDAAVGDTLTDDQIEGQFRAAMAQIGGSAVLIMNTGIDPNLALIGMSASSFADTGTVAAPVAGGAAGSTDGPSVLISNKGTADVRANLRLPGGPVSFSDNMVLFDALSEALTISLCSVAIISFDDVGMHDNHCAVDLTADFVLVNALVVGLSSCRVTGNRFREILSPPGDNRRFAVPTTLLSCASFGLLNATEMNQGTHCFLSVGAKKPRIVMDTASVRPRPVLDTNRTMIDDDACNLFRQFSLANGTD